MKYRVLILILMILSKYGFTQPNYWGGHSFETKWEKLSTVNTNIFYPQGWKSKAVEVMHWTKVFDSLSASTSLGLLKYKAPIVLQPFTTQSNGYVTYGPYKSEFYLTGNPEVYSQSSNDWLQQLTFHEYRHIQQYSAFRQYTLPKIFYFLIGEYGLDFYGNMIIPNYFWEGDAVYHETRFTNAGRGRLNMFYHPFREIFKHQHHYNWMQWRNGSMIKNIPNHYQLGYLLTSYGYQKYGDDFWKVISNDALKLKGLFYSFQHSFKTNYGIRYKDFRREALSYYDSILNKNTAVVNTSAADKFRSDQVWSYWIDSNKVIYLENSYKKQPRFFVKDLSSNKVKSLDFQWISNERQFHYSKDRIVYTKYDVNPRWHWTTYQDIVWYDLKTNQQKVITSKGKYFQPAIHSNLNLVVAIAQEEEKNELHVIQADDPHAEIHKIQNTENYAYHHPRWKQNEDNNASIYSLIHTKEGKMSVAEVFLDGIHELLFEPIYAQIGNFVIQKDSIYLNINDEDRDRLYVFTNGKFYQLEDKNAPANYYYFDVKNNKISYSNYHLEGLTVEVKNLQSNQWREVDTLKWKNPISLITSLTDKGDIEIISHLDSSKMRVKKVSVLGSPFRIYNWMTTPVATDELNIRAEAANIINSLFAYGEYNHNFTTGLNKTSAGIGIGAWITRLSVNFQNQNRGTLNIIQADSTVRSTGFHQNEWNITASVPLVFYKKRSVKTLQALMSIGQVYREGHTANQNRDYHLFKAQVQYFQYIPPAQNNIQNRSGFLLLARYDKAWGALNAERQAFVGTAYLPGVGANHALDIGYHFQNLRKTNQVALTEFITLSRGFQQVYLHQISKGASNYHMPLFYPDFGFANIYFIQRVRTQLFYDFSRFTYYNTQQNRPTIKGNAISAGVGLWLDGKIWNQYPIKIGFRYAHEVSNDYRLPFEKFAVSIPIDL